MRVGSFMRRRFGITLLETLLAAAILSASIAGVAGAIREASASAAHNALEREALEALRHMAPVATDDHDRSAGLLASPEWSWTDPKGRVWRVDLTDEAPDPRSPALPAPGDAALRPAFMAGESGGEAPRFVWRRVDVSVDAASGTERSVSLTLWRLVPTSESDASGEWAIQGGKR